MPKIYVASSWRNPYYEQVENAPNWTFEEYAEGLKHPLAEKQFQADLEALEWADACVLVLPCGRSAHTEAGWMAGRGKRGLANVPEKE